MKDQSPSSPTTPCTGWQDRLEQILSQNRDVLNFKHYTVSEEHSLRLGHLAKQAPNLYNNPEISPRSKWFDHPMYRRNSQMPPYHIHFRQEMKEVLRLLKMTYNSTHEVDQRKNLKSAYRVFIGSMRGLRGHVSIEEFACFPLYQKLFPEAKIRFLYDDHKSLEALEDKVAKELEDLVIDETWSTEKLVACIQHVLDFDDHLMAHLGEEEEIVVPMSLTDKPLLF